MKQCVVNGTALLWYVVAYAADEITPDWRKILASHTNR